MDIIYIDKLIELNKKDKEKHEEFLALLRNKELTLTEREIKFEEEIRKWRRKYKKEFLELFCST